MKLHNLFLLVVFFWVNQSFSCDCKQLERETMIHKGLEYSDIVFYGKLVKSDTISETFTFKIIELFKGKNNSRYINGNAKNDNNCSIFPIRKGLWIVYANFKKDNTIGISMCSPTIGLDSYGGAFYPPPPPPNPNIKNIEIQLLNEKVHKLEFEKENLITWIFQLEQLRTYKLSQNKIPENQKNIIYDKVTIISLIINILLFSILIFLLAKKRFSSNKQISE
jgi:hypothetical protein